MPDRRVRGVHALATGARGAEHVDPDVGLRDLDVVGLLDDRQDLDTGERGLPPALVVERADPDQPVGALLDRQRPVRVRRVDTKVADLMPASSAYDVSYTSVL